MKSIKKIKKASGMFPSEVVKIVIAVLCLAILVYLLVSLYGLFTQNTEKKQAEANLNLIIDKAESLGSGETKKILVTGPVNWVLYSFDGQLCICPKDLETETTQKQACLTRGVCKAFISGASETCPLSFSSVYHGGFSLFSSCLEIEKPFNLYITARYDSYLLNRFGVPDQAGDLSASHYATSLDSINTPEFRNLATAFVKSPSQQNLQLLKDNINNQQLIVDAKKKGLSWKLLLGSNTYSSFDIPAGWRYLCDMTDQTRTIPALEPSSGSFVTMTFSLCKWELRPEVLLETYWQSFGFGSLLESKEFLDKFQKVAVNPGNTADQQEVIVYLNDLEKIKNSPLDQSKFGWKIYAQEISKADYEDPQFWDYPGEYTSSFSISYTSSVNSNSQNTITTYLATKKITSSNKYYALSWFVVMDHYLDSNEI